jgi:Rad3-related DNA helicase
MTHTSFNRVEVLDAFKASTQPKELLSPSMDRGVDLPEDQCRAVIIAKLPYLDLKDPQVSRRVFSSKDGDRWYALQTISKIIQMCGRGVRSATDYADTYILDKQFDKIYSQWSTMFPKWFKESIIRHNVQ